MWADLVGADFKPLLRAHLNNALQPPCAARWVADMVEAATSIEVARFSSRTSLEGAPALRLTFPQMEDGEPLDDEESVTLSCAAPFAGVVAPEVPSSIARLCGVHNGFVVESRSDVIGFFEGLDAQGALCESPTLDLPGAAVDCFPNGWAWLEQAAQRADGEVPVRWVHEELRQPGPALWAGQSAGAIILQTIAAVVLGHTIARIAMIDKNA